MIKTFELIHKALLILGFWSAILLFVYFTRGSLETKWTETILNYMTSLIACSVVFAALCSFFYIVYKNDARKKKKVFNKVKIDGFECNIGQPFRVVKIPKVKIKCEALDLHSIYFQAGVLYKEVEKQEEAALKKNEDNEKIADLVAEKMVLASEFKNIQTLLANQQYSKKEIERISSKENLSKHDEIELANFKANIEANNEEEIKEKISNIKKGMDDIDLKIKEISNTNLNSDSADNISSSIEDAVTHKIKQAESGYTMYGSEDVDTSAYKEHNKQGLLFYRDAFELLYSSLTAEKRIVVDTNIANLMEALPNFKYEGVVSSTPKIKKVEGFEIDLQSYQLSIFTAFFPVFSWLELRETECIQGLALRDKRMLWLSKRVYDTYVNRDTDLKANRPSAYSLPLKDYKGGHRLAHEEIGCLVELWRYVEKAKLVEVKDTGSKKVTSNITNHDLVQLVRDLISQEDRINGGNRDKRIGFWYDKRIYLEWEKFMVEAKLLFVNYYHNEAHKVNDLDYMIFQALKEGEYLSMEIKDKFKPLDEGTAYDNGELFDVTWESIKGGDNDKENTSKGSLVIRVKGAFRRIPETAKKGSNAPTKFVPSDTACVKGSPFAESREKNAKDIEKGKELLEEQIQKSRAAQNEENNELSKLIEEERKVKEKPRKIVSPKPDEPAKEGKTDNFMDFLLKNKAEVEKQHEKEKANTVEAVDPNLVIEESTPVNDSKYVGDVDSFTLEGTIPESSEDIAPTPSINTPQKKSRTKRNKSKKPQKGAFDTEPMDIIASEVPEHKRGYVIEVREEKKSSPSYFIENINKHLERIDTRTKNERTFLSRVYLDRLRFQILSKQINIKENNKPYWELSRADILKYIPVEMQLHLLTQPVIENLYEVIPLNQQNKDEYKDQTAELQKIIESPIKRIRSINIMKITQSPEIEMYKNLELMTFRPNDLSRFIAQLEERCFELQKSRNESIEFNPTPSSDKHYGVYRILATKSGILGELGIQLKNYCAYKHKMGFKHLDDAIGKDLEHIYCVNLEASQKTVFVFFAPKRANSKYLQQVELAKELNSKKQNDLFEDMQGVSDATIEVTMTADEPVKPQPVAKEKMVAEENIGTDEMPMPPSDIDDPIAEIPEPEHLDDISEEPVEPTEVDSADVEQSEFVTDEDTSADVDGIDEMPMPPPESMDVSDEICDLPDPDDLSDSPNHPEK